MGIIKTGILEWNNKNFERRKQRAESRETGRIKISKEENKEQKAEKQAG